MPKPQTEQFLHEESTNLNFGELIEKCKNINVTVSDEERKAVEFSTRNQSNSSLWFKQTAGCITASNLQSACHTDPDNPSKSLILKVCYPEAHKFSVEPTNWGIDRESKARQDYLEKMQNLLEDFMSDSSFHISSDVPYLGASLDGLVDCTVGVVVQGFKKSSAPLLQRNYYQLTWQTPENIV